MERYLASLDAGNIAGSCQSTPGSAAARAVLVAALALTAQGKHVAARKLATPLLDARDRLDLSATLGLAAVFAFAREVGTALALYEHVLSLDEGNEEGLRGRAMMLRFAGRSEASEAAFDELLRRYPRDYEAQYLRSSLRTQTQQRNHIGELEGMVTGKVRDWREISTLAYALSKELHDLGDRDRAWFHLNMGAKIIRRFNTYDFLRDHALMQSIARAFSQHLPPPECPQGGCSAPLFIVGLPRSGSTLLERIISSHPMIETVGESTAFPGVLSEMLARHGKRHDLYEPDDYLDLDPKVLGDTYLEAIGASGRNCRYLIDKLPGNFLYLGLIRQALPSARFIDMRRSPVAACFAMFRSLFTGAYPFSYDLGECAKYYAAYVRLMAHWHTVMPNQVIEVEYEALVQDLEQQARQIISALDLKWNKSCLQFTRNPYPSMTASSSQVRQPIYNSAVDSWQGYRAKILPLLSAVHDIA